MYSKRVVWGVSEKAAPSSLVNSYRIIWSPTELVLEIDVPEKLKKEQLTVGIEDGKLVKLNYLTETSRQTTLRRHSRWVVMSKLTKLRLSWLMEF
ncbi:17.5 kDa class I heat shock protein-like protein [Corchorus olitorius]|uniref:17.5 kDa class I heat shock protein-like protein n=1 Tax=Corchorus olitorius TaxID=93759 RepID=A0A1R3KMW9_9ROSI|nr:17.5 kDa class I heat shock protein-like protein [Corchorus olitorius]